MYMFGGGVLLSVNENDGVCEIVTCAVTASAITPYKVRLLPPIDLMFEREEIVLDVGAATPLGRTDENFRVALVDALAAGSVIDPDVPVLIVGNVTVVDEDVDNVAEFETDVGWEFVEELLLLPPPPQPASAVAKTTPTIMDDKRSTRTMKRAP